MVTYRDLDELTAQFGHLLHRLGVSRGDVISLMLPNIPEFIYAYFGAIGIPSYGPPGLYGDPDGNGAHGLNERAIVKSVYTGRDMLTELVKAYASPKGR